MIDFLSLLILLYMVYLFCRYIIGGGIAMALEMTSDYREAKRVEAKKRERRAEKQLQELRMLHRQYQAEAHREWNREFYALGGCMCTPIRRHTGLHDHS